MQCRAATLLSSIQYHNRTDLHHEIPFWRWSSRPDLVAIAFPRCSARLRWPPFCSWASVRCCQLVLRCDEAELLPAFMRSYGSGIGDQWILEWRVQYRWQGLAIGDLLHAHGEDLVEFE